MTRNYQTKYIFLELQFTIVKYLGIRLVTGLLVILISKELQGSSIRLSKQESIDPKCF